MNATPTFRTAFQATGRTPSEDIALLLPRRDTSLIASKQATQVCHWLRTKTHIDPEVVQAIDTFIPSVGRSPCEPWEAEIYWLANFLSHFTPLSSWDREAASDRLNRTLRIERLALDLAIEIEAIGTPEYADVMDCVAPDFRSAVIEALTAQAGAPPKEQKPAGAGPFRVFIHSPQPWPAVLRRLAGLPRRTRSLPPRAPRPKTSAADARLLAHELGEYFDAYFDDKPYATIADCISLKLPDLDPHSSPKDVANWLR